MATIDTILNIRVEGTDSMVKLKTAIDSTSKELKELKKGAKAAGADQEKFNAKIITAETKLKGLRGELNKSKTDLIKNAKAAGDTSKSYDSLTKQNAALSASLRKLSDPLGKNRKEFDSLSKKIKTNTDTLKKMDAQMGRNQRNVGNYKQAIAGVATTVGAAIIAFKAFQRVLGTFVEFEFQMKQVGVISGATSDELLILSNSAKELGASTAFTAGEVAGLQKNLAKLGFDPTEIEAMTAATLDLAFAFGDDLDETATQVGVVLKSFKLEASETGRVTDVLAKAFASSALDLQKFSVSFPKVGAIAKQVGFSLEGTTALLGALTDAGLEASTAGTSLKNIFLKLADSNSALSKELGEGVNSVDTLLPALKDLFDSGVNVEEMLNLTDKRAVTAFATIASGTDDVSNLNTELVNAEGTAKEFADVMRDSLKGSLDEASSAADGFIINLLEKLAPAITFIVDGVALLFKGLGLLVDNFGKVALAVGAYGVVMAATAISQGVFTTALGISRLSLIAYVKGSKLATIATRIFNLVVKANPIGLLVSALVLGVAAFYSWGDASGDAADSTEDLNDATAKQVRELTKLEKIQKKNSEQQTSEIGKLRALTLSIKNVNLSIEDRKKALKEFNKLAGTNITNLKDEKKLIGELEKGYNLAVDAIKRKIIAQTTEEKVTAIAQRQIELEDNLIANKEKSLEIDEEITKAKEKNSKSLESLQEVQNLLTGQELELNDELEKSNIKISEIYSKSEKALEGLIKTKIKGTKVDEKARTEYQKLGDAVKANEDALRRAITTNGDVDKATEDLTKSKEALRVVDDKLKEINDEYTKGLTNEKSALDVLKESTKENLVLENKRLAILDQLAAKGEDVATERLKQSLKIAQIELDLALKTAEASGIATDAQIANIQRLRGEVNLFQSSLEGEDNVSEKGFLQKTLFGTNEDGEPITGDDLLNGIATTLNATSELLGGFNALQNERLNTQLGVIEGNKNAEVKAFEESAEFEILSDEERTAKIEEIQKKHDAEMFALQIAQFKKDQNFQIAQAVIGSATAVMNILKSTAVPGNAIADKIIKGILVASTLGQTALQIATIKAQAPPTAEFGGVMDDSFFAKGGMVHGNSHAQGGVKFGVGGRVAELEGGEAVINKRSTAMFKPMLSRMNVAGGGKKFADGGMVFGTDSLTDDTSLVNSLVGALNSQQVLLVESDVTNSQRNVKNIQSRITF